MNHLVDIKSRATNKGASSGYGGYLPIISVDNEIKTWKYIGEAVDKSLSKY